MIAVWIICISIGTEIFSWVFSNEDSWFKFPRNSKECKDRFPKNSEEWKDFSKGTAESLVFFTILAVASRFIYGPEWLETAGKGFDNVLLYMRNFF